ncbi:hypothetical protein HDU85_003415 [Gaertneriomyces sp. JEL0708]|nr:hypothetical protein HDU85_003415 [Gaertneriomyces sp. JEL0708]
MRDPPSNLRAFKQQHSLGKERTTKMGDPPASVAPVESRESLFENVVALNTREVMQILRSRRSGLPAGEDNDDSPRIPSDTPLLLIDVRPQVSYSSSYIEGSINVNLPVLMLKRLKRGATSSFSLPNFLTSPAFRTMYEMWRTAPDESRAVIVYDEDMDEGNKQSEAWVLLEILSRNGDDVLLNTRIPGSNNKELRGSNASLAGDSDSDTSCQNLLDGSRQSLSGGGIKVYYIKGGYHAFSEQSGSDHFLVVPNGGTPRPGTKEDAPVVGSTLTPLVIKHKKSKEFNRSPEHDSATPRAVQPPTRLNLAGPSGSDSLTPTTPRLKKPGFSINTSKLALRNRASSAKKERGSTVAVEPPQTPVIQVRSVEATSATTPRPLSATQRTFKSNTPTRPSPRISPSTPSPLPSPSPASTLPTPTDPLTAVMPRLLLGSDTLPLSPQHLPQLLSHSITHILNMAREIPVPQHLVPHFSLKHLSVVDTSEEEIEPLLWEGVDWIHDALSTSETSKVFVHCKAGRSRSATVVIAYLVVYGGMSLKEAYEKVKQARPGVSPNLGFMLALLRIEKQVRGVGSWGAQVEEEFRESDTGVGEESEESEDMALVDVGATLNDLDLSSQESITDAVVGASRRDRPSGMQDRK